MFFVIDKSKIYSYILAICTVVILFVAAAGLSNNTDMMNTQQTSANITTKQNVLQTNNIDNNTIN